MHYKGGAGPFDGWRIHNRVNRGGNTMQIVNRSGTSTKQIILIRFIAILAAIVVSSIFIGFLGYNPFTVYQKMLKGSLGSTIRFRATLLEMIPLVVTSLGI